jgi:hypothetical protein
MGKRLDIQQLEQSYYDYVDGVMNGDIEWWQTLNP